MSDHQQDIRQENAKLRKENEQLREWRQKIEARKEQKQFEQFRQKLMKEAMTDLSLTHYLSIASPHDLMDLMHRRSS